jgi:hypothetical protein
MKTNKELNKDHAGRELLRVRPKQPVYDFQALQAVIRQWIIGTK